MPERLAWSRVKSVVSRLVLVWLAESSSRRQPRVSGDTVIWNMQDVLNADGAGGWPGDHGQWRNQRPVVAKHHRHVARRSDGYATAVGACLAVRATFVGAPPQVVTATSLRCRQRRTSVADASRAMQEWIGSMVLTMPASPRSRWLSPAPSASLSFMKAACPSWRKYHARATE
jgi:hypothetical protein